MGGQAEQESSMFLEAEVPERCSPMASKVDFLRRASHTHLHGWRNSLDTGTGGLLAKCSGDYSSSLNVIFLHAVLSSKLRLG